jgi:hypothetical protein
VRPEGANHQYASHVEAPFLFFERSADAPPPPVPPEQTAAIRARPIGELGAQQAYALALVGSRL